MSYTFVKVTSFYRDFLKQFYGHNNSIGGLGYEEQYSRLMAEAFACSDFYATHLRSLGVDAHEIVANAEPLQEAWAREHGMVHSERKTLLAQLQELKPDVVLFQDSFKYNGDWVAQLREKVPSVKQVIGQCCAPFNDEYLEAFRVFDYMFVCSPHFTGQFQSRGLKVYEFKHAFEPALLDELAKDKLEQMTNFVFIGSIVPGAIGHVVRQEVLNKLLDSGIDFDIYANINSIPPRELFLRRSAYLVSESFKRIGLGGIARRLPYVSRAYYLNEMPSNPAGIERIRRRAKPPIYGMEMYKALSEAKVTFNCHGNAAGDYAANVRLYEATGVGSCLVTDWKKNLHELFDLDYEVVPYKSAEECVEKVKYLLDHPKERQEIARRGQERTLKEHNYSKRAEWLDRTITGNFK
ncbi:MAG: glycosyltransferase [Bacteroidetes bacterium]|nr:glycosyltransferase [Bacteroidota bacterium]